MIKKVFLKEENRIEDIDKMPRFDNDGLTNTYLCLKCKKRMIPVMGYEKERFFRHHVGECEMV